MRFVLIQPLGEPQGNLAIRTLHRVRTMADISADIDGKVSADSTWGRVSRVSRPEHLSTCHNDVFPLPHHGDYWTTSHVAHELGEEGLALEVAVVLLQQTLRGGH